jgi:hemerythrin-like domain-containing protein
MTAPDLTTYLAIHTALRRGAHALAAGVTALDPADRGRGRALARYWEGYAGEVHAHHTIEDDVFFPALVERVAVAAELIGRTDADHHHLDELMTTISTAMAEIVAGGSPAPAEAALRELARHMDEHLDFEDADVLPLFSRHFDAAEYEALDERAQKSLGIGKQAAFTVPFVAACLDDETRQRVFSGAPLPFRVLYRLTRRSHARLIAAALGPSGLPALATA